MSNTLTVRNLHLKYTAGFPGGLPSMTFCDGVNIIFGANASGKTTTARAIQTLLWPQSDTGIFLTVELSIDGRLAPYVLRGGMLEGDPALPYLGDATCRFRYMLAQHELLTATDGDTKFADHMLTEARGGLDLVKIIEQLDYAPFKRGSTPRELVNAQRAYREAKNAEITIQRIEEELGGYVRALAEAKQAQQRLVRLQLALDYLEKHAEEQRLADELAHFPPVLELLTGQEQTELEEYTREIQLANEQQDMAEHEHVAALEHLRQTGLADIPQLEITVAAVKAQCETIGVIEQKIDTIQSEQRRAESEAESAYRNLGGQEVAKCLNPLDPEVVDVLGQFAQQAAGLHAQHQALEAQRTWLESITPPTETKHPETLREAVKCLQQWLVVASPAAEAPGWLSIAGIMSLVLSALTGLLAAAVYHSVFGWLTIIFSLIALVCFLLARRRGTPELTRVEVQQRFAAFEVPGCTGWTVPEVERCILELHARLAAVTLAEHARSKQRELAPHLTALDAKLQELDEERVRLAGLLGIEATRVAENDSALLFFVNQLIVWQQKNAQARSAENELAGLTNNRQQQLDRAATALAPFGYPLATDSRELRNQLHLLDGRKNAWLRAENDARNALQRRQENADRRDALIEKRRAMLARLALDADPADARRRLILLLAQLADYWRAREALKGATAVCHELEGKGAQYSDWAELLASGEYFLRQQVAEDKEQAERVAEISNTIGDYERQIHTAKEQAAGEQAQAVLDQLTGKLRQRLEDTLHAAVGHYLAMELDAEVLEASLPEVFQRARQLFAEFTNGRYDLRLQQATRDFRAYDRDDGVERVLDQLSSATRVQLLMAVRMAFVEKHEQELRVKLPLLMDETLAGSDDRRERAIITSALQICRTGRQVFYFTSKPAELATWQQEAARDGVALRVVSLDDTPPTRIIGDLPAPSSAIPEPDGMSHEAYGHALGVARMDFLTEHAGSAHAWYVVEDNERLHALLTAGLSTCGELGNPRLATVVDHLLGTAAANTARALTDLLMTLEELWWQGRGKPLHFQAIQESGILSTETFRQDIPALAEQLDWDARRLIAALEQKHVKGFRASSIQSFGDYCQAHGYLAEGELLTPDMLRERLLGAASEMIVKQLVTPAAVRRLFDRVFAFSAVIG